MTRQVPRGKDPDSQVSSGAALREAIQRAGLPYEAVAHRLGLKGRSSIAQWCSGKVAVPLVYHSALRSMLRAPDLFPGTPQSGRNGGSTSILLALLRSYASMPALPLELVERTSWEVWTAYVRQAEWDAAGDYVEVLQQAITTWIQRLGFTSRRLERVRWASRHGQIRSAVYTCDWEKVEKLSAALRRDIYQSPSLDALDNSEQALILNSISLAEFFLRSRFRRAARQTAPRMTALRQALTAAIDHLGEADRRLALPQDAKHPPAARLRLELARLLLDATEASMIYEAREDPSTAVTLVLLADLASRMAAAVDDVVNPEYGGYLLEEILPRIELECRYNAAVIGVLETDTQDAILAAIDRSTKALAQFTQQMSGVGQWQGELRMTDLFRILQQVVGRAGPIPRSDCLRMRRELDELREDFNHNVLMGLARSAACLEILVDVNLAALPDTTRPEREERIQSAAEIVDWMETTVESHPDAPTQLVVEWNRAVLAFFEGVREVSTVRDLLDVLQRFREYGGQRIPRDAARFLGRIAAGDFGARAASAVPPSIRETLPPPGPSHTGDAGAVIILAPLLYPMMPISFIRPQGYTQPSVDFWEEPLIEA